VSAAKVVVLVTISMAALLAVAGFVVDIGSWYQRASQAAGRG
jgi:hypothetical protein